MNTYEWFLFGHLIGVFLLLGAAGASTAAGIAAGRARTVGVVRTLLNIQRFTELAITSLGVIVAVVFGSLLVDEAGFEYGDGWISAAYTLVILALALDHGVLMRQNRKARAAAEDLPAEAEVTDEIQGIINSPLTVGTGVLLDIFWIIFLWLMVAKPGA